MTENKRRFSLVIFVILTFGVTWPLGMAALYFVAAQGGPARLVGILSAGLVAISAFICGALIFRDGFRNAGFRLGRGSDYIMVTLFAMMLWLAPLGLDIAFGFRGLPSGGAFDEWTSMAIWTIPLTLIAGLGSEFGWRGYLLPRLALTRTPERAVIIHSVLWWIWRLPLFAMPYYIEGLRLSNLSGLPEQFTVAWVVAVGALAGIMSGVIYAYFWMRSGSLLVTTVYYTLYTGLRDAIWITIGFGYITQAWPLIVVTIVGIFLIFKGDWRQLAELSPSVGNQGQEGNKYS